MGDRRGGWETGGVGGRQEGWVGDRRGGWETGGVGGRQEGWVGDRRGGWETGGVGGRQEVWVGDRCGWETGGVGGRQEVWVGDRRCGWETGGVGGRQEGWVGDRRQEWGRQQSQRGGEGGASEHRRPQQTQGHRIHDEGWEPRQINIRSHSIRLPRCILKDGFCDILYDLFIHESVPELQCAIDTD